MYTTNTGKIARVMSPQACGVIHKLRLRPVVTVPLCHNTTHLRFTRLIPVVVSLSPAGCFFRGIRARFNRQFARFP